MANKKSEMTLKDHQGYFGDANNVSVITSETAKADPVLDWEVEKSPVYTKTSQGFTALDNTFVLTRGQQPLSTTTVKQNYHIVQNNTMIDWFAPYLERNYLELAGYGYFKNGQTVFVQAFNRFEGEVDGDQVESYFLMRNHHTGGGLELNFCTYRAICKNTLDIASKEGTKIVLRHNQALPDKLDEVHHRIDLAKKTFDFNIETYQALAKKRVTKKEFFDLLCFQFSDELKAREKKAESKGTIALPSDYPIIKASLDAWDNGKDLEHLPANGWKAYNAFNGVVNHGYGSITPEKAFERTINAGYINKIVEFKKLALA